MKSLKIFDGIPLLIVLQLLTQILVAQHIPLTDDNWQIINNDNNENLEFKTVEFKGKQAIHLGRHQIALLRNKDYENFVLEADIAGGSMPGIGFRANNLFDYEYLYFRTFYGDGKNQEAIQYIPIFNGSQAWQLYNYPHYETSANFKPMEWFHVKLEVSGAYMKVYVGDMGQARLTVKLLQDELKSGDFFFKTTFADAYYANVEIKPLDTSFSMDNKASEEKYISHWEACPQIDINSSTQNSIYQALNKAYEEGFWKPVVADKKGLLNLAKFYSFPKQGSFVKTIIKSDKDQEVELIYDYTYSMTILLNGTILFSGKELDTNNFMRVMDGEERLKLSLRKGENELIFLIQSDEEWQVGVGNPTYLGRMQAMNWGFIAKLSSYEGIEIQN